MHCQKIWNWGTSAKLTTDRRLWVWGCMLRFVDSSGSWAVWRRCPRPHTRSCSRTAGSLSTPGWTTCRSSAAGSSRPGQQWIVHWGQISQWTAAFIFYSLFSSTHVACFQFNWNSKLIHWHWKHSFYWLKHDVHNKITLRLQWIDNINMHQTRGS